MIYIKIFNTIILGFLSVLFFWYIFEVLNHQVEYMKIYHINVHNETWYLKSIENYTKYNFLTMSTFLIFCLINVFSFYRKTPLYKYINIVTFIGILCYFSYNIIQLIKLSSLTKFYTLNYFLLKSFLFSSSSQLKISF